MITHVLQAGWGYWDTTFYPYGGCFKRATAAFGVTIVPNSETHYPNEAVVTCPGDKGMRTLVVKRAALIPVRPLS